MSSEIELLKTLMTIFGATTGGVALLWNVWNYRNAQKGFMKLQLECHIIEINGSKYIKSKTSLENTSRRPIFIYYCGLLIYDDCTNFDEVNTKLKEIIKEKKGFIHSDPSAIDIAKGFKDLPHVLRGPNFVLQALPYYHSSMHRITSLEELTYSHIYEPSRSAIFSVNFLAIAEDYLSSMDPTYSRLVQDKVVI